MLGQEHNLELQDSFLQFTWGYLSAFWSMCDIQKNMRDSIK